MLRDHGWLTDKTKLLEPCVGDGALVRGLKNEITAYDLFPRCPEAEQRDYLSAPINRTDLVLTNPPFGRGASLASKFLNKAALDSDHLAFVLPQTFRKASVLDRIDQDFWPVFDSDLPDQNFRLPDGSIRNVKTCFQLWERREERRPKLRSLVSTHDFFEAVEPHEATYAFRTQGCKAGQVLPAMKNPDGSVFSSGTTAYLKGGRERLEAHDWSHIAQFTASVNAIGLTDIRLGLQLEDQGGDIDGFLRRGAISLLLSPVKPAY